MLVNKGTAIKNDFYWFKFAWYVGILFLSTFCDFFRRSRKI